MKHFSSLLKRFFMKPEYVFVVPALVFGLLSAFLMPQLVNNDENMHFVRSYELTELEVGDQCTLPKDIVKRGFSSMYGQANPDYRFETTQVDDSDKVKTTCGSATSYNPLMHLPQTVGVLIAKLVWPTTGGMILFGRIANVLFYCIALFFIIRKAKIGKWLIVVVGLLPTMIHIAGSLTGDVVNSIVLIGFITYVFNLFIQKTTITKKQIGFLVIFSALLAITKMTNLVLLLPILFLPKDVLPKFSIKGRYLPNAVKRIIIGGMCGVAAIAVFIIWTHIYGSLTMGGVGLDNPVAEKPYKFLKILFNTYINPDTMVGGVSYGDWLLRGVVGSFASFKYHLPYGMVVLIIGLLVAIGLKKDDSDKKITNSTLQPLAISTAISFVLVVFAMTYGLYAAWAILPSILGPGAQFALGLQGRYFTPLILLLLPTLIYLRRFVSIDIKKGATTGVLVFSIMVLSLIFYMTQTINFITTLPT